MSGNKHYLGDGVYMGTDELGITLWTSDGVRNQNAIFIEPEVLKAFLLVLGNTYDRKKLKEAIGED